MKLILLIDDDVLSLELLSKITSLMGFRAITSESARNGLALAANEKPALILVDLVMDEMDGAEFVRQIRRSPEMANLPVLIFSAGTGCPSDVEQARRAGADGFLSKPISLVDLYEVLQTFTGQASYSS